jgi:hypothetical protein
VRVTRVILRMEVHVATHEAKSFPFGQQFAELRVQFLQAKSRHQ